jgi:hypothetical protein
MTTSRTAHEPGGHALRALALLVGLLALLASAGPAAAATGCGEKVIDDWFDGRIDGTYPLHCYDDAIDQLPRDVRDYSSAKEDIERALQARLRGETAPPNSNPPPDDEEQESEGQADEEQEEEPSPVPPAAEEPSGPASGGDDPEALPSDGGANAENASSVPLPLLLLAGLALLLVAGGAAGYVVRRVQARRVIPPAR